MGVFLGRKAILVSKHKKEEVIAPLLKQHFDIDLQAALTIDTDLLGTFSGEVERKHSQYETARLKIENAREYYPNENLFIASEGSFNPHPEAPVVTINTELVLLVDYLNNIEIAGWYKTYNTNLAQKEINSNADLLAFANDIGFPSNGIILSYKPKGKPIVVRKGADSLVVLVELFEELKAVTGSNTITAETDMRACYNVLRMDSIRMCTINLIDNMKSVCPKCDTPGFVVNSSKPGLPCSLCGMPTRSVLYYEYKCNKCNYTHDKKFPLGKEVEEPTYCDFCNP